MFRVGGRAVTSVRRDLVSPRGGLAASPHTLADVLSGHQPAVRFFADSIDFSSKP